MTCNTQEIFSILRFSNFFLSQYASLSSQCGQARRAFRALRSLVKLQALARGAYVRKQAAIAFQFMNTLVRLQVRVRTRQLLNRSNDDDVTQAGE